MAEPAGDDRGVGRKRGRDQDSEDPFARFQGQPAYSMLHDLVKDGLIKLHDFDEGALNGLEERSPADAMRILEVFRTSNPQEKDNKSAYLCSLLKHKKRPDGRVCAAADRILQDLQRQGRVRPGALDERCMDNLARLPNHVQVAAAEEFASKNLTEVRNMAALFTSVIKAVDARSGSIPPFDRGGSRGGGGGGFAGGGGGGRYGASVGSFGGMGGMGGMGGVSAGGPAAGGAYGPPQQPQGGPGIGMGMSMPLPAGGYGMGGQPGGPPAHSSGFGGAPLSGGGGGGGGGGGIGVGPGGAAQQPGMPQAAAAAGAVPRRRHWGVDQVEWGVRVDELHQVSASAPYIHPAVAKKLQDLWDEGSNLLSLLDDGSWEALTTVGPRDLSAGLAVLRDAENSRLSRQQAVNAGAALPGVDLDVDTVNTALQRSAAERLGPGAAAAAPMQRMGGGVSVMPGDQGLAAQGLPAPGPGFGPPPDRGFTNSPNYTTTQNGGGSGNFGGGGGGGFGPRGGPMPSVPHQYQPQQQPFQQPPGRFGGGGGEGGPPSGGLRQEVEKAVAGNRKGLRMDVFDGGIMGALAELPPQNLQIALAEIAAADYNMVRKPGGYIMGIIKRHRQQ